MKQLVVNLLTAASVNFQPILPLQLLCAKGAQILQTKSVNIEEAANELINMLLSEEDGEEMEDEDEDRPLDGEKAYDEDGKRHMVYHMECGD